MEVLDHVAGWAILSDNVADDLSSSAHAFRETSVSLNPHEPFYRALEGIETACGSLYSLLSELSFWLNDDGPPPDLYKELVRALWQAHQEIERLQEIVDPREPNFTLGYIRRLLAQL